jgi:hypothetical protein
MLIQTRGMECLAPFKQDGEKGATPSDAPSYRKVSGAHAFSIAHVPSELCWRPIVQTAVRPSFVVILAPEGDLSPGIKQALLCDITRPSSKMRFRIWLCADFGEQVTVTIRLAGRQILCRAGPSIGLLAEAGIHQIEVLSYADCFLFIAMVGLVTLFFIPLMAPFAPQQNTRLPSSSRREKSCLAPIKSLPD